jgi:alkyldihydroxyacetonephosphate synthase
VFLANKHNVVIIPYGGGSNVTGALECRPEESRMIVSLDCSRMTKIKWIDRESMTACIEAGIIGVALDEELAKEGLMTGHEPVNCKNLYNFVSRILMNSLLLEDGLHLELVE